MTPSAASTTRPAKPAMPAPAKRIYNFSAGPGTMPEEVLRQIQEEVWDCRNTGVGILEHSHRAPTFDRILAEAIADCREVGAIPAHYQVLFVTGGSTGQNFMVPMNLLPKGGAADYFNTGHWAQQSIEHAKFFGTIHECASSKGDRYSFIPGPEATRYSPSPAYIHYTSNNTIFGTQVHGAKMPVPPAGAELVCDMCSDIYSRPFDISRYGLIYASAQKNLGAAGVTVVIARDDLIQRGRADIPVMLQYRTFASTESRPNTPPVFTIYATGLMFKWIRAQGGTAFFEKHNAMKAAIVYDVLDRSSFYTGHARPEDRSLMNITFRCPTTQLDDRFCMEAEAEGLDCLKGHRTAGGMRASLYNAMPVAGARALAGFMVEFERRNG